MLHVHVDPATGLLNLLTADQMSMFSTPAPGEFSNIGRNFFRLPWYSVVNLSFGKITRIAWKQSLELRIEMQNALNSVHYDQPASARINSSVFGVVDFSTVENFGQAPGSSPRTMQLSAKYTF